MVCIGIDIEKDKHGRFIMNVEGEILADVFAIPNNREGFQSLRSCTIPLDKIRVGLETTRHYSYNILGVLFDNGLAAYVITPLHTNLYRKSFSLRRRRLTG